MANESTQVFRTNTPISFICANATGIEKGAILKLTDPFTAIITSAANDPIAGICAAEKVASDGLTSVSVYRDGIFKVYLSGSCTAGDALVTDAVVNYVKTCPNYTTISGANIIGYALETGTTGQSILMELKPNHVRYA